MHTREAPDFWGSEGGEGVREERGTQKYELRFYFPDFEL